MIKMFIVGSGFNEIHKRKFMSFDEIKNARRGLPRRDTLAVPTKDIKSSHNHIRKENKINSLRRCEQNKRIRDKSHPDQSFLSSR